jgi:site-specific recombinase XerD
VSGRRAETACAGRSPPRTRLSPRSPAAAPDLALWLNDERPNWKGATTTNALLLNQHGGRLGTRGADNIMNAIADEARLTDEFTNHVLRHSLGTTMIRQGHDTVVVDSAAATSKLAETGS